MSRSPIHSQIIATARKHLAEIFEHSEQSVYVYLDDLNKACNKRFASLLGYRSPAEWAAVRENFPEAFVSPADRQTLITAYRRAMQCLAGSTVSIRWKKKGRGTVATTTILVPVVLEDHRMAMHFISPK